MAMNNMGPLAFNTAVAVHMWHLPGVHKCSCGAENHAVDEQRMNSANHQTSM